MNRLYVFADESVMTMLTSALFTVLYASMRASLFEKQIKKNPLLQEAVQFLDMKSVILFPVIASVALMTLFFFMGSIYYVLLFIISAYSVYGIYFALKPFEEYYSSVFSADTCVIK